MRYGVYHSTPATAYSPPVQSKIATAVIKCFVPCQPCSRKSAPALNTCYRVFSACAIEDCYGGDKMLIQLELLLSALRSYSLRFAKQNFRSLASRFIEFGSLCSPSLYAKFN